jgi:hypothetical protein
VPHFHKLLSMIRDLLISPQYLVIATLVLWLVLFQAFYRVFKISEVNWKRLEYIWLFAGFLGLINLVIENKKEYNFYSSERVKNYIGVSIKNMRESLTENRTCFQYSKSEFSPYNLVERQSERDRFCAWAKKYLITYDTIKSTPKKHFKILDYHNFRTDEVNMDVADLNELIKVLNSEISEYNLYRGEYDSNDWKTFSKTFGILLLVIAFAIRLSIATKNTVTSKKKVA